MRLSEYQNREPKILIQKYFVKMKNLFSHCRGIFLSLTSIVKPVSFLTFLTLATLTLGKDLIFPKVLPYCLLWTAFCFDVRLAVRLFKLMDDRCSLSLTPKRGNYHRGVPVTE